MTRLPRVYQTMLELQMLDITKEPIEIAPTAHYSMGGVWVRPDDHGTDVPGLYAIGEASSGLHGANRLGGNSLIELLVFGRIVGQAAATYSASLAAQQRSAAAVADRPRRDRRAARGGRHRERARPAARHPQHHDRARRSRARRSGPARRARRARRDRGAHRPTSASTPTSPATRTWPTPSTSSRPRSPRAPPSRPRSNGARPADATTAATTPRLDESLQVNLVWSPRDGRRRARRSRRSRPRSRRSCARCRSAGKLVE